MHIALLFNEKLPHGDTLPDDHLEEYDSIETVEEIAAALRDLNLEVSLVPADRNLPLRLEQGGFGFAFNIAEGPVTLSGAARRCREAIPAAICELLEIPYTGSDPLTLALTLDKTSARRIVSPEVPVARAVLLDACSSAKDIAGLQFPVIVKPNDEGSSKGIHHNCIASDPNRAMELVRLLESNYRCQAIVEEFLPGVEITVGIAGNTPHERILGMMEIAPAEHCDRFVYSLEVKRNWKERVAYHIPPRVDSKTLEILQTNALTAYHLLGCRDIARLDFRCNAEGVPCFMECNALPGLNPENSDIVILSRPTLPYRKLVQGILLDAATRAGVRLF